MSADPGTGRTTPDTARRTLGEFVRRMRDRAIPDAAHATARRRARGLRREEVAVAAGISVTWYTWLEQGRPVRVSRRTLGAVARALRLSATERAHLLRLADAAAAPSHAPRPTVAASPGLRALVDALRPHPAYAVNARWDVLHANAAAVEVFGDFAARPGVTDNVLRRLFLDAAWRTRFAEWDDIAASAVAQFRAATGHLVGDAGWKAFVAALAAESDAFHARWADQGLADPASRTKVLHHATLGRLRTTYASFAPDGEPADVRVVVYVPDDEATRQALARGSREPRRTADR